MRILTVLLCLALLALRAIQALPIELDDIKVSAPLNGAYRGSAKQCVKRFCDDFAPGAATAAVQSLQRKFVVDHLGEPAPLSDFRETRPRYSVILKDADGNSIDQLTGINFEKPPGVPHVINAKSRPVHFDPIQKAAPSASAAKTTPSGKVAVACLPCRQAEVKCDGARPVCGQCAYHDVYASWEPEPCVYVRGDRGGRRKAAKAGDGSHVGAERAPREKDHGSHSGQHAHTAPEPQRLYDLPLRQLDGQVQAQAPAASGQHWHAPDEPVQPAAASGGSRLCDLPLRMLNGEMR